MAPPEPVVLQVKKEEDSTNKSVTEVKHNVSPEPDDVIDLNKQFKTWTFVFEGFCCAP